MTDNVEFARTTGSASAGEAHRLRHEAASWLAGLDMDDDDREQVLAAVNEAVENAVEHAYPRDTGPPAVTEPSTGTIELTLWVERDAVNVQVTDHGHWPEVPGTPAQPGSTTPRGRGIVLMHRSVDSVSIRHDTAGTVVVLRHHRHAQDHPQSGA